MKEDVAAALRAISHPARLAALEVIREHGEITVKDLCEETQIRVDKEYNQSAFSQHLSVLREANLVDRRKESQRCYYRLNDDMVSRVVAQIDGLKAA